VTDYDYDNHRVSLDSSDRSQNTATALEGYPLNPELEPNWPGADANPREQRFNKGAMEDVARAIDQLIRDVGRIDLQSATTASFGPDSWQAAVYLKDASSKVARTVNDYSQELIQSLTQAAQAIRTAAGNYGNAESANTANVDTVNNNLGANSGSTGTTVDQY